ncbi:hypothetical protein BDV19DRAFT_373524 [Aspergillus venezuelensis]
MENTTSVPLQELPRVPRNPNRPDSANNRDGTRSRASSMTAVQSVKTPDPPAPSHAFRIRRSRYGLFLAIVYAAFALSSWIITCWLSYRPIGGKSYRKITERYADADRTHAFYVRSERWFHAARVLQAITTVLTLPLTSAICATAAVIYMQRSRNLTLRQVMALADREWLPFAGNSRLIFGRVKFWSWFLILAFVLNLLGLIIAPLQAILVSSKTIKTPVKSDTIGGLLDLIDPTTSYGYDAADDYDSNLITVMTRNALKTETREDIQSQLWAGAGVSCNQLDKPDEDDEDSKPSDGTHACRAGGATFDSMSDLPNPFLAELPSGFNTGLVRQFAPRINSTATYQNITAGEFPQDCQSVPNGLFLEYSNITWSDYGGNQTWGVQVCMPGDITQSPWRTTRDRQDFSELLYLNVSQYGYIGSDYAGPNTRFYRLTLDTTAGYFELPNYMNGGVAGELLEKDPSDLCREDCEEQGYRSGSIGYDYHSKHDRRQSEAQVLTEPTEMPYEVSNRGPLLTLALALFGEGSFIATRARNPSAYATTVAYEDDDGEFQWWASSKFCIDTVPLGWLFSDWSSPSGVNRCIRNDDGGEEGWMVDRQIGAWLENFKGEDWRLENDFTAAAFLANREWMKHRVSSRSYATLEVSFDLGADTQVPSSSLAGVIVISTLLGVHVLSLLALGLYSAWSPRWTSTLDSFSMMRMGADILPDLPMHLSIGTHNVDVLDSAPGFVGDAAPGETVGKLGVGAAAPIKKDRYFKAFHKAPHVYDPHRPPRLPGHTQLHQSR